MNQKALINFSAHALSDKAKQVLEKKFSNIEEIYVDLIDFNLEVEDQLRRIVSRVKTPLDGSIAITVIVPGHATVAVLLVSYLTGIIGHIPNICLLEMDEEGFYVPTNEFYFNGNDLRSEGRKFRQELWLQDNI